MLLTVMLNERQVDLEMPSDVPLGQLIPLLLQVSNVTTAAAQWEVTDMAGRAFAMNYSLDANGIVDGVIIIVRPYPPQHQPQFLKEWI